MNRLTGKRLNGASRSDSARPPHVETGLYVVRGTGHYELRSYRGRTPKVHCFFALQSGPMVGDEPIWRLGARGFFPKEGYDDPEGVVLPRYYNAHVQGDAVGAGWKSDLMHEVVIAMDRLPDDPHRLDLSVFAGRDFVAEVESVTEGHGGNERHPLLAYSKIARLIRAL